MKPTNTLMDKYFFRRYTKEPVYKTTQREISHTLVSVILVLMASSVFLSAASMSCSARWRYMLTLFLLGPDHCGTVDDAAGILGGAVGAVGSQRADHDLFLRNQIKGCASG